MSSTVFISTLPENKQAKINKLVTEFLTNEGFSSHEISNIRANVMADRLCILEEFIDISQFLI